jgi:hypothetical protein
LNSDSPEIQPMALSFCFFFFSSSNIVSVLYRLINEYSPFSSFFPQTFLFYFLPALSFFIDILECVAKPSGSSCSFHLNLNAFLSIFVLAVLIAKPL